MMVGTRARILSVTVAALALGACGGGGDGGDEAPIITSDGLIAFDGPTDAELAEFPAAVRDVVNAFTDLNESTDPTTDLPVTGQAEYSGTSAFELEGVTFMTGDANGTVFFGDLDSTMTFQNFTAVGDGAAPTITGSFGLGNGRITGNELKGGVAGTLTVDGTEYGVGGDFEGTFGGSEGAVLLGVVNTFADAGGGEGVELNGIFGTFKD